MPKIERVREAPGEQSLHGYLDEKLASGWRLVAVEWERPATTPGAEHPRVEPLPFGLRVGDDCHSLQEDSAERGALVAMMELISQDKGMPEVAFQMNQRGYRTRSGDPWTPSDVFELLPRLIEAGPGILTDAEYIARKRGSATA